MPTCNLTPPAYFILLIFLVLLASILLYALIKQTRSNNILNKTEEIRSDILRKIIHEFRSPLTIISGLSHQLRDQKDMSANNSTTYLNSIERQSKNLIKLVNQLLDISELRSRSKNLQWKTGDIVIFTEMVAESFQSLAAQKDIKIFFYCEENEIITDFVPDYLNKILQNLINNAVKFSESGSLIYIIMERHKKDNKKIIIKVIDQGKGISKDDLPNIFDLFYQIDNHDKQNGSGIGLTLAKQAAEITGGNIEVESKLGKGTTFAVGLPISVSENELYSYWVPEKKFNSNSDSVKKVDINELFNNTTDENDTRHTILLAEDNKDVALFIRSIFPVDTHNILYAGNGEKALEIAKSTVPDIIITDIIMSKKNGVELCRDIKSSPLLSHIPIIIISGKSSNEDVIEGLKNGANDYLKKPFEPDELILRVKNLLQIRNNMQQKYQRAVLKNEKNSVDKKEDNLNIEFLQRVTDIIYSELKNPDFTTSKLAQKLAISVSQLNKKLNAIAGCPASSYILKIKIHHAKKILHTENKTIGEVAAECGIYDVNYFSRVFKKQTGLTPTKYSRLPTEN